MSNHLRKPFYRRKRFWAGVVLAPVIIALSGWVMIWIDVQQRLKDARADGLPTSNKELEQYYQLPPDCHDSTQQWLDAMQTVRIPAPWSDGVPRGIWTIPCAGEVWENEEFGRELVTDRQATLQKFYDAASTEGAVRYPTEISKGRWDTKQSDFDNDRRTTLLLHVGAAVATRDDDISRAVRDIEVLLALGKATQFEVPRHLIQLHISRYTVASIAVVHCAPEKWTDPGAHRVQKELHEADFHSVWERWISGDFGGIFEEVTQGSPLHLRAVNQREILKFYHTALNPEPTSWPQASKQYTLAIDSFNENFWDSELTQYIYRPVNEYLLRSLVPTFGRCDTERQCAIVVLAMARHRLRHGSYPQTASDIDGDLFPDGLPRDPWLTTSTIKVLRAGDSFTVYGVGEDGIDDGGKVEYDEEEGQPPDVGFVWKPLSTEPKRPQ